MDFLRNATPTNLVRSFVDTADAFDPIASTCGISSHDRKQRLGIDAIHAGNIDLVVFIVLLLNNA